MKQRPAQITATSTDNSDYDFIPTLTELIGGLNVPGIDDAEPLYIPGIDLPKDEKARSHETQ